MNTNVLSFIAKRFLRAIAMVWVVITTIFVLFRVIPSDPSVMLVSGQLTEESQEQLLEQFGLNQPIYEQYIIYVQELILNQNMGVSFTYREPVTDVIIPRFINTLILMIPAFTLLMIAAFLIGSSSGWRVGKKSEMIVSSGFISLRSLPHFVMGLFLMIIFSYKLGWTPIAGMGPRSAEDYTVIQILSTKEFYYHLALPFATVFIHWFADPYLLMRGNMIDERDKDYIRFHHIKGLSESYIKSRAAKNSMLPMLTYVSTLVSIAFSGVVLIEVVFSWPGIGREIVEATFRNDYPVAQGAFLISAIAVVMANFIIDLVYGYLDPRIEYGKS